MSSAINILLCTFNGERFLPDLLNSLIKQSHSLFEIYIFDDASTDATPRILEGYSNKHTNIHLRFNTHRLGFINNFEQALHYVLAKTPTNHIAFCDQDDIWHKNKLADSQNALTVLEQQHPNKPALIHSNLQMIDENGNLITHSFFKQKSLSFPHHKSISTLLGYNGVMGNTLLINRQLAMLCLPFPKPLKYHDYWISSVNELFGVRTTLDKPLISYRIHNNNTSNNKRKTKTSLKTTFKKVLQRNYLLPFFHDQREHAIQHLLRHFPSLEADDRRFLEQYHQYLTAQTNRLEALAFLVNNRLLKPNWKHKLSVTFRVLLSRAYKR